MKTKLVIEQFDNGITIQMLGENETFAKVYLDHDRSRGIGDIVWDDIMHLMNAELNNKVEVNIEYKVVKDD